MSPKRSLGITLLGLAYDDMSDEIFRGERIGCQVWKRMLLDDAMSWLNTLGGGYSALGDYFVHHVCQFLLKMIVRINRHSDMTALV